MIAVFSNDWKNAGLFFQWLENSMPIFPIIGTTGA
jgi:hypothetical protein